MQVLFLGQPLALDIQEGKHKRPEIIREETRLLYLYGRPEDKKAAKVKENLEKWYREEAREYLYNRTAYYGKILGEYPENIRIKEQKTCWGSCSSKRNLNFNWKLLMAPLEILDYVVVHELCHLKYMNHSRDFWNCVGEILPDYAVRRQWLKENGRFLKL